MKGIGVFLILALLVTGQPSVAADTHPVRLRWVDLGGLIQGKQASVTTADGSTRKGRVRAVEDNAILFENSKTPPVDRTKVAELRMVEYVGNGRSRGKFLGGMVGLVAGLVGAAAIGSKEGSGHRTGDKVLAGTLGIGGFPLGLAAGYLLGRQADKQVTVIHIIP